MFSGGRERVYWEQKSWSPFFDMISLWNCTYYFYTEFSIPQLDSFFKFSILEIYNTTQDHKSPPSVRNISIAKLSIHYFIQKCHFLIDKKQSTSQKTTLT